MFLTFQKSIFKLSLLAFKSRAIRFLFFGGATSIFCLILGYLTFIVMPQLSFTTTNTFAGIIGIFLNFYPNSKFIFGGESFGFDWKELYKFGLVAIAGIAMVILFSKGVHGALAVFFPSLILQEVHLLRIGLHGLVLMMVATASFVAHCVFTFAKRNSGSKGT